MHHIVQQLNHKIYITQMKDYKLALYSDILQNWAELWSIKSFLNLM